MKKKKILFQTDFSLANTGFGKNAKVLLDYLYRTGKYDLVNYCVGINSSNQELKRTPWKSIGCLPDSKEELMRLNQDPNNARAAGYGAYFLDKVMQEEKPDIYIGIQDIWGIDFAIPKKWFKKITSVLWTTLDSLPILPSAVEAAKKTENYWIWSSFATKALNEMGYKNVKTMHGVLDDTNFFRLENFKRKELRKANKIPEDSFIVGFVFRNQLRKSVPNLLEGYKAWREDNPNVKNARLLLHTHFGEGWNIPKLADEYKINKDEILTTYVCGRCLGYEVKQFKGQELDCNRCGEKKCLSTTNPSLGITEQDLNEVYNLMDVYCHPFTSGGQEIPIQEAKLTELITLVTNYSCGEEMCELEACSFPLDWAEYREHGTEFKKASTFPSSIAKQIGRVFDMPEQKRREMGRKAREWTIANYSVRSVGKIIEEFLDKAPFTTYDFEEKEIEKDPFFSVVNTEDGPAWISSMYSGILKRDDVKEDDDGHKYWMNELKKGTKRIDVENYFRQVAMQENNKNKKINFEELLDKGDEGKRIIYVMPEGSMDIFLSTSLFKSIKEQYPDYHLYVATKPEFFDLLAGNPYVFKVIGYLPQMDNLLWLEGTGENKGFFEIAYLGYIGTQRAVDYLHNGKDKIAFDLKYARS